ncbi:MAG TPA: fibronectin-binding domain-containing protein [Candidatus Woesearchaeota archaeon]|nr:fibronectin-binding domain-containing protein [Candidatus Woesearchaeota archaeon]
MRTELTSLDLYYLVKEFQVLVGARIDKIYEQEEDRNEFLFVFHKSSIGKYMLRFKLPRFVYLTDYKQAFPSSPPGFCVFLRKHLAGARIREVKQKGFERILEIVFNTKLGVRILICELFSKGNMILVDENYMIKGLLKSQNWQARTIRGGARYEYPPEQPDTPTLSKEQIKNIITKSKKDALVKILAVDLGLGGLYAEELCKRAGVDKRKTRLDDEELTKIFTALKGLFNERIRANLCNNELLPFELLLYKNAEKKHYAAFNQALDDVLTEKIVNEAEAKIVKEKQSKEDKIRLIIKKQEERMMSLERSIKDNQRKGELIYEHYHELKELLDNINSDRKKLGWSGVKKKYQDNRLVRSIDEKKGLIIIELMEKKGGS